MSARNIKIRPPNVLRSARPLGRSRRVDFAPSTTRKSAPFQARSNSTPLPVKATDPRRPFTPQVRSKFPWPSPTIDINVEVGGRKFLALALRDACTCPRCVDPSTKQKYNRTTDIPAGISVKSISTEPNGDFQVTWNNDIPGYEGHTSTFSQETLGIAPETSTRPLMHHQAWDAKQMERQLQFVDFWDYMADDKTLFRALIMLHRYGLLLVRNVPMSETAVEGIAGRIGNIRDSFYGRTWDVRSVPEAKNVAYTSMFLGLHMDLLYMKDPPCLQLLHCLENSCEGGASLFSDTAYAASELDRSDLDALRNMSISYQYKNAGEYYRHTHKVFESTERNLIGRAKAYYVNTTNYSPPFQAGFQEVEHTIAQVDSLRRFADAVESPKNCFGYKLQEGECVIFANRRVLHGRGAFDTTTGSRWLKGTYIDSDAFMSKSRVLMEKFADDNLDFLRKRDHYVLRRQDSPPAGISSSSAG